MSLPEINWPADGMIPAVVQDDESDDVLMVGFMNAEALLATHTTNQVHFWSRSRAELWHKGGTSGHVQHVRSISINCDLNSLLIRVEQVGAVCHDGYASCYYRDVMEDGSLEFNQDRLFDPRDVYGDGYGLEALTRQWWGAYVWLRDHDLEDVSSTSELLRDESAPVLHRIKDELNELAGVLDGSHTHTNQRDDFILEASQCSYWLVLAAIKAGLTWDVVRVDRAIDVQESTVGPDVAAKLLRAEAMVLGDVTSGSVMHLFRMIAESARTLNIDPRDVFEFDLADLKSKSYLSEYLAR